MTKEELVDLKTKFIEDIECNKDIQLLNDQIKELEENPIIKNYFDLVKKRDDLLDKIASRKIYTFMGAYASSKVKGEPDKYVNQFGPNVDYFLYRDIKLEPGDEGYELRILPQDNKKFKNENLVLELFGSSMYDGFYNQIKAIYNESSKEKVKKIGSMKN